MISGKCIPHESALSFLLPDPRWFSGGLWPFSLTHNLRHNYVVRLYWLCIVPIRSVGWTPIPKQAKFSVRRIYCIVIDEPPFFNVTSSTGPLKFPWPNELLLSWSASHFNAGDSAIIDDARGQWSGRIGISAQHQAHLRFGSKMGEIDT